MKKKFTLILLTLICVIACALGLAACGTTTLDKPIDTQTHEHVWAAVWSTSETNHWHACAVSGCSEMNEVALHSYVNEICICGKEKATNGLEFTLNSSGDGYSVSKGTATDAEIFIPTTYNGKPVTSIGNNAFEDCNFLTSITISNSVTSIGALAFKSCSSLTSITIPNSVTIIGYYAFIGCSGLESITIASGNTKYHSAGNCLIETESKMLIAGCKNSVIPTDGSVTIIGWYAFVGCIGLTSITIPDSVTSIGWYAFGACGLTRIDFNGTKAQWNAISKGSDWNSYTGNFTIYCTDGNLDKDGNEIA